MIIVIDNYDSFTYNLVHFLGELGASLDVHRNDQITPEEVIALKPEAIVLSPGPCTPNEAGICLDLIDKASEIIPIFGVCLGHQAIGQTFGGTVMRAPSLMHGKTSRIHHTGKGVFNGLPQDFEATRYHSLTVAEDGMPDCLEITAKSDDGVVMGFHHKTLPVHGVQFHPESIASEHGHALLKTFLELAGQFNRTNRAAA
ncbi:MAG: aminodeoxychorismate/anthranilate synthase component II [Rhodobiaceae bacterium]|nr:aminodeoxychorismate/anthranilate synthase component II [Rhodobiaceae bacterium]